jgi:hypothetical protein
MCADGEPRLLAEDVTKQRIVLRRWRLGGGVTSPSSSLSPSEDSSSEGVSSPCALAAAWAALTVDTVGLPPHHNLM